MSAVTISLFILAFLAAIIQAVHTCRQSMSYISDRPDDLSSGSLLVVHLAPVEEPSRDPEDEYNN